jgi:hypothetical protein
MAPFTQQRMLAHLRPEEPRREPAGPGGRPTEYRPEYCELVIEKMGEGLSLAAFAGFIRVSRETVYAWCSAHREFSDAVSRAKPARQLWLEQKLLRSRKGAETTAAIFALRNAAPEDWKDVKHTEHQHLHAIRQLSDAELNAIAAGNVGNVGSDVLDLDCERIDPQQANVR